MLPQIKVSLEEIHQYHKSWISKINNIVNKIVLLSATPWILFPNFPFPKESNKIFTQNNEHRKIKTENHNSLTKQSGFILTNAEVDSNKEDNWETLSPIFIQNPSAFYVIRGCIRKKIFMKPNNPSSLYESINPQGIEQAKRLCFFTQTKSRTVEHERFICVRIETCELKEREKVIPTTASM